MQTGVSSYLKQNGILKLLLSYEPNNHYILDSMGWIHFKLGNIDIASQFIKKAYAINKDPEIAAHLGEILWVQGKKEEAKDMEKFS